MLYMALHRKKSELAKSPVIDELPAACADEAAAVEFIEAKRWAEGPCCPHCGSIAVYKMTDATTGARNSRFLWRCRDCEKQYTVRINTIFQESLIPLHKWVRAFWEASSCKNGVSALELSRKLQISYKSALFMAHRIRHAMTESPWTKPPKMGGTVEADETYVGGKPRYKELGPDGKPRRGRRPGNVKSTVLAIVERGGDARAIVTPDASLPHLRKIFEHVEDGTMVVTDELRGYGAVAIYVGPHRVVKHSAGEYVKREDPTIHTNTIEGFFSRIKRMLGGTHHAVSKKHLHRYVQHAVWLYNARKQNDGDRLISLILQCEGKRLMLEKKAG